MNATKKLIALILGAVMLFGLLTGCSDAASSQSSKAPGSEISMPAGMLILSAKAAFQITYDQDGMVMEVEGANDDGNTIVAAYKDYTGKSCSTVMQELIAATAEATLLREATSIVLKVAAGSRLPSETFLASLAKDVSTAATEHASSAPVVTVDLDALDVDGYINAEIAQTLLKNHLGIETLDSYSCDDAPQNDTYTAYITVEGIAHVYQIDAVTGLVFETFEEETIEPDEMEEEVFEEVFLEEEEEYIEETNP